LAPLPPGAEEVSLLTARYFRAVTDSFNPAAAQAVTELHAIAGTRRAQAAGYAAQDAAGAADIASQM
jgi:hypothetical protein